MEFMPESAPLVILTFLGTCFALGATGLVIVYGFARGKPTLAKYAGIVALGGAAVYAGLLLSASLTSTEKVLRAGQQKYFCEVDCHVAYSVVNLTTAKTLGPPLNQRSAGGTFYVVKVKTWFDERTISSHRGYAPLSPNPRRVVVIDDQGRQYEPSDQGQAALEQAQGKSAPLTQTLRPGESYTTDLVFDLPHGIQNPWLLITDASGILQLLIGHESSPFHKKIYFGLAPQPKSAFL